VRRPGRLRGLGAQEKWGYGVWLFAGLVFGVLESWAGIPNPSWPALSDTIAHLESIWAPTAVIVAALIVLTAFAVIRKPPARVSRAAALEDAPGGSRPGPSGSPGPSPPPATRQPLPTSRSRWPRWRAAA